jgi:hypothetical protein
MLITFHSDESADVIMFGDAAKALLTILGKDPQDSKGIVTVEQLPGAIASLRAAIDEDRARQSRQGEPDEEAAKEQGQTGMAAPVGLAQRGWPLLEMLERSSGAGVPVTWGS